jgi:hypothetical protein
MTEHAIFAKSSRSFATPHSAASHPPCRIIEETLDQFYAMKLPMRSSLLRGLTVGFDTALQQYISKLLAQIGDRDDLIPPAPALTRFKKDVVAKVRLRCVVASALVRHCGRLTLNWVHVS